MSNILCFACGSAIHEKEDCPYLLPATVMRRSGIDVTAPELREMDDEARR